MVEWHASCGGNGVTGWIFSLQASKQIVDWVCSTTSCCVVTVIILALAISLLQFLKDTFVSSLCGMTTLWACSCNVLLLVCYRDKSRRAEVPFLLLCAWLILNNHHKSVLSYSPGGNCVYLS